MGKRAASDESKFMLFDSDGITYLQRPIGSVNDVKYQLSTVKHGGGSVMDCGTFSGSGVGPLIRVDEIMGITIYVGILEDVMLPFARRTLGRLFIFQQDNNPKQASRLVRHWFQHKRITKMKWPSQRPDLKPIEHL